MHVAENAGLCVDELPFSAIPMQTSALPGARMALAPKSILDCSKASKGAPSMVHRVGRAPGHEGGQGIE